MIIRKPMRDLYRETNPFTPVASADPRALLRDFICLGAVAAFVVAAALVTIAYAAPPAVLV